VFAVSHQVPAWVDALSIMGGVLFAGGVTLFGLWRVHHRETGDRFRDFVRWNRRAKRLRQEFELLLLLHPEMANKPIELVAMEAAERIGESPLAAICMLDSYPGLPAERHEPPARWYTERRRRTVTIGDDDAFWA